MNFYISLYIKIPVYNFEYIEADDVIAVFAKNTPDNHLIISTDKDFYQLYDIEEKWNPNSNRFIKKSEDIEFQKLVHVVKGDISDGIPNIFIEKIDNNPKRISKKHLISLKNLIMMRYSSWDYQFNKTLIGIVP